MYESFYGLTGKPFQLNPDPAFFFGSRGHKRAFAYLQYGVYQSEGFIVITGEIGAGKTTLVRSLFEQLDRDRLVAAQLVSTQLDADDMLRAVAVAFGLPVKARRQGDAAGVARSVPVPARRRRQARAARRRRGAEPHAARDRGTADAVEFPARRPGAAAELPDRPAGVARR